jgi:hypothetical protein
VYFWEVNFLDLNLKWSSIDNYILVAASILAAVAAGINDTEVAFIVLAVGMILKATASAIYPNATLTDNLDNIDNIILAATTVLSCSLVYFGLAEYAFMTTTIGTLTKGMLSKRYRDKAA